MSGDLASWLLEQVAEDERVAGDLAADGYPKYDGRVLSVEGTLPVPWPDRWNPVLVLRECDAKRRAIEALTEETPELKPVWCNECGGGERALLALALAYKDRPGYRQEWAP